MRLRTTGILATVATVSAVAMPGVLVTGCGAGGAGTSASTETTAAGGRQAAADSRPPCFPSCQGQTILAYPLEGADLRGGNFTGARWHGARLRGANLAGANLTSADFGPRITGYWHDPANPYDTDGEERPSREPDIPSDQIGRAHV